MAEVWRDQDGDDSCFYRSCPREVSEAAVSACGVLHVIMKAGGSGKARESIAVGRNLPQHEPTVSEHTSLIFDFLLDICERLW